MKHIISEILAVLAIFGAGLVLLLVPANADEYATDTYVDDMYVESLRTAEPYEIITVTLADYAGNTFECKVNTKTKQITHAKPIGNAGEDSKYFMQLHDIQPIYGMYTDKYGNNYEFYELTYTTYEEHVQDNQTVTVQYDNGVPSAYAVIDESGTHDFLPYDYGAGTLKDGTTFELAMN